MKLPLDFDWKKYLSLNPSLGAAGLKNERQARYHYFHYGKKKGYHYSEEKKNEEKQSKLYENLIKLSKENLPWVENKKLIDSTYEFTESVVFGEKTKKLTKQQISNIENLNSKIDPIFNINKNKTKSLHNKAMLSNMTNFEALDIFNNHSEKTIISLQSQTKNDIVVSVVLPLFRAKNIAWVAFESLIRQENINFYWELVIIEENFDDPFGLDNILKYKEQLKNIGCVTISYISLNKWLPLSAKWFFLIQESNEFSKMIALCAADMYQSKLRLSKQYNTLIETENNWYKLSQNVFYDLESNKHAIYPVPEDKNDSCCVMVSKSLADNLPLVCIKRHVDSWLYNSLLKCGLKFFYDTSSDLKNDTINVHGINNLSIHRNEKMKDISAPYKKCCDHLENHLPKEIIDRFQHSIKFLSHHKNLAKNSKINFLWKKK